MQKNISHRIVEHHLDMYFNKYGIRKIKCAGEDNRFPRPDVCYRKPDKNRHNYGTTILVEIKSDAVYNGELVKGIGQVVWNLCCKNYAIPVLVIHKKYIELIKPIFVCDGNKNIGLMSYNDSMEFEPVVNMEWLYE